MPKTSKSSATSATRKKHQKKAASALGIDADPSSSSSAKQQSGGSKPKNKEKTARGKKDGKKSEPRVKAFIPPVKPGRRQPDPLDVGGLARRLPPELVVVLRNVGKKAQVTKIRALEELGSGWVERVVRFRSVDDGTGDADAGMVLASLVEMIPAWMHYVPSLFIHPSRRVRLLAISVHLDLLKISEVRRQILFYLKETATSEEVESVLGSWCVLGCDVEKSVAGVGRKAWDSFVRCPSAVSGQQPSRDGEGDDDVYVLSGTSRNAVFGFVQRAIMDPLGVYNYLNPPPTSNVPTPPVSTPLKNQRSGGPGGKGGIVSKQRVLAEAVVAARKTGSEEEYGGGRSKMEEYEESEVDRKARLRIGGLGGLKWFLDMEKNGIAEEVVVLLKNPLLWTVLYHGQHPPFVYSSDDEGVGGGDGFGFGQPNVRKAGWGLLMKLLEDHKAHMEPLLQVLSSAVLRSAWVEPDTLVQGVMWQPLLTFIKEFPSCWNIELESSQKFVNQEEDGDDEDEEDEGEDEGEEDQEKGSPRKAQPPTEKNIKASLAYQEFLQFLQLGCLGSPVQGYPTVVIILSTIPSSIMASSGTKTPVEDLFTSLWAALDGRALSSLHRAVASAAFLSAVLECAVFMSRRIILEGAKQNELRLASSLSSPSPSISLIAGETEASDFRGETGSFIRNQFGKVWEEIRNGKLKVEERAAARLVARNLDSLRKLDEAFSTSVGVEDTLLRDVAWRTLESGLRESARAKPGLVTTFLKVLFDHHKDDVNSRTEVGDLVYELLGESVLRVDGLLKEGNVEGVKEDVGFLECMLEQFREGLFDNQGFAQGFDELLQSHAALLLESSPKLLFSYFAYRKEEGKMLELWHVVLGVVVANSHDLEKTRKTVLPIIRESQKGGLPGYLRPKANELDDIVGNLLGGVLNQDLSADAGDLEVIKAVLNAHEHFVSEDGYANFIRTIGSAFNMRMELLLGGSAEDVNLDIFIAPLELLDLVLKRSDSRHEKVLEEVLPNVFLFGYLVPHCAAFGFEPSSDVFGIAIGIWEREARMEQLGLGVRAMVVEGIKVALKDLINDPQTPPLPEEILKALAIHGHKLDISLLRDIFPSADALNGMLRQLPQDPIDNSIAVINPLVPPEIKPSKRGPKATDSRGFSSYPRIVVALLHLFSEDRTLARGNLWALRHFIALSIYAGDYQKVPAGVSPVFDARALAGLGEIIGKVQQITAYLLLGSLVNVPDGWRRSIVKRVGEGNYGGNETGLERFVMDMMRFAVESDGVLDTRILEIVLEDVLDDVETEEAEEWIGLARRLERRAPQTSMTLITAITETEAEPFRLDRYRNEQAAELLGIKPGKINTDGLLTLRRLAASAPNMESDVVFLPQNRAVNVVKACQGWVTSDDADVEEEVESAMTLLFAYLAPILQNVPGSHWDLIWDVLENNLENSSITDDGALVTLARSLQLVIIMEDLVKTNKALKAEWEPRRKNVLQLIRDIALVKLDTVSPSLARSTCRESVLTILKDLPESLMDESTLSKMCHLVTDHSIEVQKLSYGILRLAARKRTEYLVVEAGVDSESTDQSSTLPPELFDIVQRQVSLSNLEDEDEQQAVLGTLLGWMLVFDLFQDASFKVKSRYIEQLRNLELLSRNFIPLILAVLHLENGLEKAFKLDVWAVQEYCVDLFELGNPISISLLSAHLYYRALLSVPSLVYSWLSDCKDRQLTTAVTAYTSQHFSPVIIEVELAHVKGPTGQELTDDSMTVKVAAAVNEVLASYLVDDHQLEIKLKIPPDWPLHKIEVKDTKRVGVDKDRWRAWILAVQQTIWSHNGRITDGLSLFKKNATLHFEGQVECAICYSIISVTDGSLPKKPCKTCKNKFHAGCLYKWFHTSNTSTCPLCRTEILLA